MKKLRLFNISWDTSSCDPDDLNDKPLDLPNSVIRQVSPDFNPELQGADLLSDEFGFCVNSFNFEWVK